LVLEWWPKWSLCNASHRQKPSRYLKIEGAENLRPYSFSGCLKLSFEPWTTSLRIIAFFNYYCCPLGPKIVHKSAMICRDLVDGSNESFWHPEKESGLRFSVSSLLKLRDGFCRCDAWLYTFEIHIKKYFITLRFSMLHTTP